MRFGRIESRMLTVPVYCSLTGAVTPITMPSYKDINTTAV